jgi:hypothetical protein
MGTLLYVLLLIQHRRFSLTFFFSCWRLKVQMTMVYIFLLAFTYSKPSMRCFSHFRYQKLVYGKNMFSSSSPPFPKSHKIPLICLLPLLLTSLLHTRKRLESLPMVEISLEILIMSCLASLRKEDLDMFMSSFLFLSYLRRMAKENCRLSDS